jgi:glyoxylase-like metal-dependent hydrolase (beta-lactamase superfamily II)/rhodanese-related sulfurtransferase
MGDHSDPRGYEVITIETPELGDRSYVVTDGHAAAVIDPQRDIDRTLAITAQRELEVTHVLETHIHNDYVSGGLELARRTGADYCIAADEDVAYERRPVKHGDRLPVGDIEARVIHTPGHTPTHLSFVIERDRADLAVFSGGSLLYGTVGRTDLISRTLTEQLARAQYRSARRLAGELPDAVAVYPTHGFGSFCSSIAPVEEEVAVTGPQLSTIGAERRSNRALTTDTEDEFVHDLIAGLTEYPRYYAHMGPANRSGPLPIDLAPPRDVDPEELRTRIVAGEWVVDLRSRRAFAAGHLAGTIGVELADSFTTYLGWTIPWGTPITLLGDTAAEIEAAQRALARIGIDRPAARSVGGHGIYGESDDVSSYRVAGFSELAAEQQNRTVSVLDVRRPDEWNEGHITGSVNVPLPDLLDGLGRVPGGEVWVHCRTGYRASVAASLLDRAGREVVLVDDEWDRAAGAGLDLESG